MTCRLLKYRDLKNEFGLERKRVWPLVRKGRFPASVEISPGRPGWRRDEVEQWFADLPAVPYAGADKCKD